ncbi:MAG: hypothetical protein PHQ75_05555 [Thermoguttaceae bacterium]|nr:hypothetical protein [Thermoguttaceae bacterium]
MRRIFGILTFAILLLLLGSTMGIAQEPLWQLALDKAGPNNNLDVNGSSFHGPLPQGVGQNYIGWQPSAATGSIVTEKGQTFFRFVVSRVSGSGPQFAVRVPKLKQGKYYRITVSVRNDSDGVFSAYLREGPAPYQGIGQHVSFEASSEWQSESTVIRFVKPGSDSYSLYFNLCGCGVFDIREFSISQTDYAAYDAQVRGLSKRNSVVLRRPETKWKNYAHGSCFPFGVPSGWNCRRGMAVISADRTGPSGQFGLLVKPGFGEIETPRLYSAPFQVPDPKKTYTVSFSCKGSGNIVCNGKTFQATKDWQRFDLPIKIPEGVAGEILDFSSDKAFLLDAVRIAEEGQKEFSLAGPSEVVLALPDSDASDARIQFDDEKPLVRYVILGEYRDVTLAVSVTNIWGQTKEFTVKPTAPEGSFEYAVFPQVPRGQFRVDVRAVRDAQDVSPVAEFVVTRLARPLYWGKDAPDSPFGIHVEPIAYMLKGLKAGGLNWVRLHDAGGNYSLWAHLEPEKGKWIFYDRQLQSYRRNGLMIYGQLGGAPVWANYYGKTGTTTDQYWIRFCSPTDEHMADFENYARKMVQHYKGVIHDWCLWNEPYGSFLHKGYDPVKHKYICFENQGGQYARIMKAAYKGAKESDPTVKISGYGTTGSATTFTQQVFEAAALDYCDELDFHQYTPRSFGYPGDGMKDNFDKTFLPITEKTGPLKKNVIMSEGSPLSNGSDRGTPLIGMYQHVLSWNNTEQYHERGDRVVRFIMALRSCGVKRIFLYTAHGHRNLTQCSFQLLLSGDGYPHPSLAALSAFAQHAENATFVEYRPLVSGVYLAVFKKNDGSTFAVVTGKKRFAAQVSCSVPGAKASDLYGNPLTFPIKYEGYVQYITAPCPPEKLTVQGNRP